MECLNSYPSLLCDVLEQECNLCTGGAPVASPVGAGGGAVETQLQQLQLQRQQQYQRLQQLQAQRDHAAHHHAPGKPVSTSSLGGDTAAALVGPSCMAELSVGYYCKPSSCQTPKRELKLPQTSRRTNAL